MSQLDAMYVTGGHVEVFNLSLDCTLCSGQQEVLCLLLHIHEARMLTYVSEL